MSEPAQRTITLGDPAPWFRAKNLTGQAFDLHVSAGRWVVMAFVGDARDEEARKKITLLADRAEKFSDDHLVTMIVFSAPPSEQDVQHYLSMNVPSLKFVADYDGVMAAWCGADKMRRTLGLDPMLRTIADIPWDEPQGHDALLDQLMTQLPSVDDAAGVPMTAPALIVPRVFDFPLCEALISLYEKVGGSDSGFMLDIDGKTVTALDYSKKRRHDMSIVQPEMRDLIRQRIVKRLVPAVDLYFSFKATRMDRHIVSCYEAETGGHFFRHRDNLNAGAAHRRFAVSINLNGDYDGCDLIFPEFGRRTYRAPVGGAVVFSCGALHQVTPITRGKRYAFIPFLYGEEDARRRLENNARLHKGERAYDDNGGDKLFPDGLPPETALRMEQA